MQALGLMSAAGYPVEGILHVGANDGQERYEYLESGARPCIYVEPIDAVFRNLQKHIQGMAGHMAVKAVCSDVAGERISFNIASNGGLSSSILPLGPHADFHPSVTYSGAQQMTTTTVDQMLDGLRLRRVPNLMVVDTQGAELKVLKGARTTLAKIEGLFVEVSEEPLYEGGCTHAELSAFLQPFGMRMRWMSLNAHGHGDAFYCKGKDTGEALPTYGGNLALGKAAQQSSQSVWSKPNDANGAVSGRKTGSYGFHTGEEDAAWWQVDLGAVHPLKEIRIFNRIDACRERASTLRAYLSDTGRDWQLVHDQGGHTFGGVAGRPLRIMLDSAKARYVRLQLREHTALHLDEVEVY